MHCAKTVNTKERAAGKIGRLPPREGAAGGFSTEKEKAENGTLPARCGQTRSHEPDEDSKPARTSAKKDSEKRHFQRNLRVHRAPWRHHGGSGCGTAGWEAGRTAEPSKDGRVRPTAGRLCPGGGRRHPVRLGTGAAPDADGRGPWGRGALAPSPAGGHGEDHPTQLPTLWSPRCSKTHRN